MIEEHNDSDIRLGPELDERIHVCCWKSECVNNTCTQGIAIFQAESTIDNFDVTLV